MRVFGGLEPGSGGSLVGERGCLLTEVANFLVAPWRPSHSLRHRRGAGRIENDATLRDRWYLRRDGDDLGSAGEQDIDTELVELPLKMRWHEWMGRVEAMIFASPEPVRRGMLARVVGRDCNLDLIIDDIRGELRGRPYELVSAAGGWQHRTRKSFADAIRASTGMGAQESKPLPQTDGR